MPHKATLDVSTDKEVGAKRRKGKCIKGQHVCEGEARKGDLQTDRVHNGEVCSEHLIQLSSGLAPENQGGEGAEHEASTIQPADGGEAV